MNTPEKDNINSVREALTQFLDERGLNKTSERYAVLKEVYTIEGRFDADELYLLMKNKSHTISRATIYNTLELLVESQLVSKHRLGSKRSRFEACYFG